MDCGQNAIMEARIQEAAARHMDLMTQMMRIDDALARQALASIIHADPAITFAQAVGEAAMWLRHQADQMPCRTANPGKADLRTVIAYTLDQIGLRYPEPERFHQRFHFAVEGDAPPGLGRGSMEFLAWQFGHIFTDRAGRPAPGFKEEMIDRVAAALNRPLPAKFFDLIKMDIAMTTFGIRLYCEFSGDDPSSRLAAIWRSFHPDAVERARSAADQAMATTKEFLQEPQREYDTAIAMRI